MSCTTGSVCGGRGLNSSFEMVARVDGDSESTFSAASTAQIDGDRGDLRSEYGDRLGERPEVLRSNHDEEGDFRGDSREMKANRRVDCFSGLTFANSARRLPGAAIIIVCGCGRLRSVGRKCRKSR